VVKNLWDINESLPLNGGASPARLIAIWETEEIFQARALVGNRPLGSASGVRRWPRGWNGGGEEGVMGEKGGVGWFGVKSRVASFRSLSCGFFPLFFPLPLSVSRSSVASLPRYFPEERARDAGG
jgi:hypothetical protein